MEKVHIISQTTAGRTVTLTGLTYAAITQDNILGIINETQSEPLYTPMDLGNITNVTYSSGTLTIQLASTVPSIASDDKLLIKLYFEDDYATESNATTNKNAILAKFPELLNAIKDYLGIANTDDGEGGTFDALTATEVKTAAAEVWASVWGEVLHTASEDLPLDPYGNIIEEEESESSSESV